MSEDSSPVIVEHTFAAPRDVVWKAITERDQMVQWFFDNIPEFRAEEGFHTQFNVNAGDRDFLHLWTITEVIPGEKIVYDWRYKDMQGIGKVTFELHDADDGGTLLRVINEGLETFPREVPEFTRESCVGGWQYFIQGNLNNYLTSGQ